MAKHCGCDPVPSELRSKVLVRIRQVQAEIELIDAERPSTRLPIVEAFSSSMMINATLCGARRRPRSIKRPAHRRPAALQMLLGLRGGEALHP